MADGKIQTPFSVITSPGGLKCQEFGGRRGFEERQLEGKQLTGYVSIHRPTGMYRGSVDGWGSQHETPEEALEAACQWLLKRAETKSEDALRKQLHEFYEEWK